NADTIAAETPGGCDLVSIGAGDGEKERLLLESLLPDFNARYIPVDVSSELVDRALERVDGLDVDARGYVAFCEDLPDLRPRWDTPFLLCLLGNNFCNYHPEELLQRVLSQMSREDLFLVDAHLRPEGEEAIEEWRRKIDDAYGSQKNIRFNLWPLFEHGADPEACRFDIGLTEVETPVGSTYRTRKHIRILEPTTLSFGDRAIDLEEGEVIEMGFTYKYTAAQFRDLLASAGFSAVKQFRDDDGEHALILAETG
ncbi:MAG: L-histidine N(alpha)-methyltransferase, partial [Planctomycetota bacterium]